MSFLIDPYRFGVAYDTDAQTYITAVEFADGQALETAVKNAINAFVVGCKSDGIWTAIKASCILAGARTLSGALVPLVGAAPTNNNFVAGDYDRKTGLVGNGSNKYLNSNRLSNADPRNNQHLGFFVSTGNSSSGVRYYLGGGNAGFSGLGVNTTGNPLIAYMQAATSVLEISGQGDTTGYKGAARSSGTTISVRTGGATTSASQTSAAESTASALAVFAYIDSRGLASCTNARLAFYSIGESLDLALLDSRVSTLISALAAAIP